jgi:hypothetical protein
MKMYKTKKKWKNIISLLCFMTFCYMFIWAPRQIAEKFAEKYGVVKNTIFAVYSEKFRKFPISLKSGIRTPYPMGIMRQTLRFSGRKTLFLQKSAWISAKFPKAFCENWRFS